MSVDLDWSLLTPSLASSFLKRLNSSLQSLDSLPEFLGDIEVTDFEFGDVPAEVTLVDVGDVSRELVDAAERDDADRGERQEGIEGWPKGTDGRQEDSPATRQGSFAGSPVINESQRPSSPSVTPKPSLQLHLHVFYSGNPRLSMTASLLVNYPSPLFMSLPLKLSVTAIVFEAEVVLALEADRSRAHVCILEPEGPTGTSGEESPKVERRRRAQSVSAGGGVADPGRRIMPEIVVETEVGNADKHVLRNVGKVERFVADLVRKLVCDELLFPNFHTISWAS